MFDAGARMNTAGHEAPDMPISAPFDRIDDPPGYA
jgi:hypothetical protein